jgi:Glyoxalase-like domain
MREHRAVSDVLSVHNSTRHYGGPMASVKQFQVTFDCAEPERVARFWCEVLGYVVPPPPEGFATWDDFDRALPPEDQGSWFACIDPSGAGPRLFFQRVPEGKVVKNRLHLDVRVGTGLVGEERLAALEAECARLQHLIPGETARPVQHGARHEAQCVIGIREEGQERVVRDEDGGRAFGRHSQPASSLAHPPDRPAARA